MPADLTEAMLAAKTQALKNAEARIAELEAENERLRWALGKGLTEAEATEFLADLNTRAHMAAWQRGEETHTGEAEETDTDREDQP